MILNFINLNDGSTLTIAPCGVLLASQRLQWDFLNVYKKLWGAFWFWPGLRMARQDGPDWLQCTEHKVSHWNHCNAPFYRVRPGCCPCPPSGPQSCRGPRQSQLTHWTAHRRHAGQSGSQTANSDDCAVMLFITRVADISLPSSSQSSHLCTLPHRHRPDIKLSWLTLDSGHWIRN